MLLSELNIEQYKYLYSLAKNHKKSRKEILENISVVYHELKDFINNYREESYAGIIQTTSSFIGQNFPNENLKTEFEYNPPLQLPELNRSESLKEIEEFKKYQPTFWEEFLFVLSN